MVAAYCDGGICRKGAGHHLCAKLCREPEKPGLNWSLSFPPLSALGPRWTKLIKSAKALPDLQVAMQRIDLEMGRMQALHADVERVLQRFVVPGVLVVEQSRCQGGWGQEHASWHGELVQLHRELSLIPGE